MYCVCIDTVHATAKTQYTGVIHFFTLLAALDKSSLVIRQLDQCGSVIESFYNFLAFS